MQFAEGSLLAITWISERQITPLGESSTKMRV